MWFQCDPVSVTSFLVKSSRERTRLPRLYCEHMRKSHSDTIRAIVKSYETIRHNELSMTPEMELLVSHQRAYLESSKGAANRAYSEQVAKAREVADGLVASLNDLPRLANHIPCGVHGFGHLLVKRATHADAVLSGS